MAYVTVPIELTEVDSRLILNFTTRQIVCFGIGAAISIPLFLATRGAIGTNGAMVLMIISAVPAFLFAVYKKDGIPLEKFLLHIIRQKYFFPPRRPYKALSEYGRKKEEVYAHAATTTKRPRNPARKHSTAQRTQAGASPRTPD